MALAVEDLFQPTGWSGQACAAGTRIVSFNSTSMSVFNAATETAVRYTLASPAPSTHQVSNPGRPWYEASTGHVWNFFNSTTHFGNVLIGRFDPTDGSATYWTTAVDALGSLTGGRECVKVGSKLVILDRGFVHSWDVSSGVMLPARTAASYLYGGWPYAENVYWHRTAGPSETAIYNTTTNAVSFAPRSYSVVNSTEYVREGDVLYMSQGDGAALLRLDLPSNTVTDTPTPAVGTLGPMLVRLGPWWYSGYGGYYKRWNPASGVVESSPYAGSVGVRGVAYGGNVYFLSGTNRYHKVFEAGPERRQRWSASHGSHAHWRTASTSWS